MYLNLFGPDNVISLYRHLWDSNNQDVVEKRVSVWTVSFQPHLPECFSLLWTAACKTSQAIKIVHRHGPRIHFLKKQWFMQKVFLLKWILVHFSALQKQANVMNCDYSKKTGSREEIFVLVSCLKICSQIHAFLVSHWKSHFCACLIYILHNRKTSVRTV
jgi:hypothetical protein